MLFFFDRFSLLHPIYLKSPAFNNVRRRKPFNFDSYLFQFALLKVSGRYLFFCKIHHIIMDGWGYSVFIRQLFDEYRRFASDGNECLIPPSYLDFIPEDQKYMGSISHRKDIDFWREKFQEIPEPFFNSEAKDKIVESDGSISGRETLTVKRALYNQINSWCETRGCSTFHFILGTLIICFYKIFGSDQMEIGVPILNRKTEKLKRMIGHFANMIPLKITVNSELFFEKLLIRIKSELRECYRHQKLTYGEIYRTVHENDRNTRPLFEIALSYEKNDFGIGVNNITKIRVVTLSHQYERNVLSVYVREYTETDDVDMDFDYRLDVFDRNFPVQRIVKYFNNLLNTLVNNPVQNGHYLTIWV
jgi:hypothetical protein